MNLFLPKYLLDWLDDNRGAMSRQAFIVKYLNQLAGASKKED